MKDFPEVLYGTYESLLFKQDVMFFIEGRIWFGNWKYHDGPKSTSLFFQYLKKTNSLTHYKILHCHLPIAPTRKKKLPCVKSLWVVLRLREFFGVTATSASAWESLLMQRGQNGKMWVKKLLEILDYLNNFKSRIYFLNIGFTEF